MLQLRIDSNGARGLHGKFSGHSLVAAVAVGLAIAVMAPVSAQTATPTPGAQAGAPRARGGRRNVSLYNIPISALNYVVKLTDDEKNRITSIRDKAAADIKAEPDRMKHRAIETQASDDIKAALTTDQASTFAEYLPGLTLIEQSGAIPLKVLADVKLTEDQIGKITPIVKDTDDQIKALSNEDRRTKRPELLAAFKTKIDALLTPDQLAVIAKASPQTPATTAKPAV